MASAYAFDAIGTSWNIDIPERLSTEKEESLLVLIRERIEAYDKAYSRFRSDSIVSSMAEGPGVYAMPEDSVELFTLYKKIYDLTDGKVTPLIGDVLVSAGYDAEYSLTPQGELTVPLSWDEVFTYEPHKITMHIPTVLDIGAGGKGHLIDIVGRLLEKEGVMSYVIDAGGDLLQKSTENSILRVGLEDPRDRTQVVGVVEIVNGSVCGSAGNRRVWEGFHHIIDPFSLSSPTDILAVWVVAETAFVADMLTTALFFVSAETLMPHFNFSYALIYADGTWVRSAHFPAEFFTN